MARKSKSRASNLAILLIDDDVEYATSTLMLLEREGHRVLVANSGAEGIAALRSEYVDLVLLDYIMPEMTGEDVVNEIRTFNDHVQVILQTGYANENPPRSLLKKLDIQGYHDKSEGPEKLLMWVDVGLKAATSLQMLRKSRQGLSYILSVTPELHKIQPLVDLLQGIMLQITGLIGASNSFLAVNSADGKLKESVPQPELAGFLAMPHDDTDLLIRASTGRFVGQSNVSDCLDEMHLELVSETLKQLEIQVTPTVTVVPLCVGPLVIGVVFLDKSVDTQGDIELLQVFANQAAAAIHSSQLYEMATLDLLTGVHLRRFFEQWITRELRTAFRLRQSVAMMLVDMDGLKLINDTAGHLAGDHALMVMGKVLRQSLRESDIAGRYGGDEFAVFLPQTDANGTQVVGQRILHALQNAVVAGPNGDLPVRASIGVSSLDAHEFAVSDIPRPMPKGYFQEVLRGLLEKADSALYKAKNEGRGQVITGEPTAWLALDK